MTEEEFGMAFRLLSCIVLYAASLMGLCFFAKDLIRKGN